MVIRRSAIVEAVEGQAAVDWLFERMIELAAWVAFILGVIFLCDAIWMLAQWASNYAAEGSSNFLAQSGQAAAQFVAASLALGCLACIDRYVFDLPEES